VAVNAPHLYRLQEVHVLAAHYGAVAHPNCLLHVPDHCCHNPLAGLDKGPHERGWQLSPAAQQRDSAHSWFRKHVFWLGLQLEEAQGAHEPYLSVANDLPRLSSCWGSG
jgi:hypothetical protein